MVVGVCRITVAIPESEWADTKRSVVKKIIGRTRASFNVCLAELVDEDVPGTAVLAMAAVGSDHCVVNSVIDKAVTFIQELYLAEIEDYSVELIHL
ncbi:MAG TPA: DUF503 domain-containing protein [Myxococcota bacterium]|nr:DUF503 domain-containing protein [Myxococcota bacterium]HOA13945.1 DUF503 domain-containing protein [Myxococcota bacterium]HOC99180.1 DUF503 domain-containing protein [Myxococcota bacterium]HOH77252.1 DUF503 domain-containing protein [Myxococcota bacterium]HPV04474.1 DUF503 domain-containing protein [Myxococcota bacterium]